jgi:hypothetical protein
MLIHATCCKPHCDGAAAASAAAMFIHCRRVGDPFGDVDQGPRLMLTSSTAVWCDPNNVVLLPLIASCRRVGDPFGDVDQGPQVDADQYNKILEYIDHGKNEGATLQWVNCTGRNNNFIHHVYSFTSGSKMYAARVVQ